MLATSKQNFFQPKILYRLYFWNEHIWQENDSSTGYDLVLPCSDATVFAMHDGFYKKKEIIICCKCTFACVLLHYE